MTIYEKAKSLVTAREAAEHYGLTVNRHGMALCPFHDDHNPSMKLDERFHCFGCREDGDVIDFTAKTSIRNAGPLSEKQSHKKPGRLETSRPGY